MWALATAAALTLSWFGVFTVLSSTAYDPAQGPAISPVARPQEPAEEGTATGSESSSTHRPLPSSDSLADPDDDPGDDPGGGNDPTPAESPDTGGSDGESGSRDGSGDGSSDGNGNGTRSPSGPAPGASHESVSPQTDGEVRSYSVTGGRVTFEMHQDRAALVAAAPNEDWEMQVWKETGWIRVTFSSGDRSTSVFCVWHDRPPTVETYRQ